MKYKYLNAHIDELKEGQKIRYRGRVYWMNTITREIYALDETSYDNGVINGWKYADVSADYSMIF